MKSMSPEARAQATIAIGANVEWRRTHAVAAALKIDAIVQHKKFMSLNLESEANAYVNAISEPPETSIEAMDNCTAVELDDREDCSVAAYQVEVESFVIADKELDDAESLTCMYFLVPAKSLLNDNCKQCSSWTRMLVPRVRTKTTLTVVLALCAGLRGILLSPMTDVGVIHICGEACANNMQQLLADMGSTMLYIVE